METTTAVLALTVLGAFFALLLRPSHNFPRVGPAGPLGYVRTALRGIKETDVLIDEGLVQFGGKPFVLPSLSGSYLIISGRENIEVLRKSDDSIYNQPIATNEALQLDFTMDPHQQGMPYQAAVTRSDITRNIAAFIPEVLEETQLSMAETFSPNGAKRTQIKVFDTMTHLIARISNRAMVGVPMCRDEKYTHAMVHFAETLILYAQVLQWSPPFIRPLLYKVLSTLMGGQKEGKDHLEPFLRKRLEERAQGVEKPVNIADFLINAAPPQEMNNPRALATRVMNLNFGSIHTSSIFGTHALFELAAMSSSDRDKVRADVITALEQEGGWGKPALAKFRLLDSLLREIGRVYGLGKLGVGRLIVKPAVLPDGTAIPAGWTVSLAVRATHFNEELYERPDMFDAFRFARLRAQEGSDVKYGFTTLDNGFLPFGIGRHACPGRFFASMELKVMLAHALCNWEITLPEGVTKRPDNVSFGTSLMPPLKAELVFTKRDSEIARWG